MTLHSICGYIKKNKQRCKEDYNMTHRIKRAAVLGSGVMGSAIAAHLANNGIPTIMLDIVPRDVTEDERSEEHTSELQSRFDLVCRLLLEKKNKTKHRKIQ